MMRPKSAVTYSDAVSGGAASVSVEESVPIIAMFSERF